LAILEDVLKIKYKAIFAKMEEWIVNQFKECEKGYLEFPRCKFDFASGKAELGTIGSKDSLHFNSKVEIPRFDGFNI